MSKSRLYVLVVPVALARSFDCETLGFAEANDVCGAMLSFSSCATPRMSDSKDADCNLCAQEFRQGVTDILRKHDSRGDGTR